MMLGKTGNGYISKEKLEELLEEVSNKLVDGITRLELEERTISPRIIHIMKKGSEE
jgi:hypothetical protein